LFLWTSPPNVKRSLTILESWEFEFSTKAFTWVKLRRGFDAQQLRFAPLLESDLHCGLGLTTRKQTEDVLLGRRGNCRRIAKDVRETFSRAFRTHATKRLGRVWQ
jgi:N6-adenosine-specific RNA methylase IME4